MDYPKTIRALVDYPNSGLVKKGEIGVHAKHQIYNFPSQRGYSVSLQHLGTKYEVVEDKLGWDKKHKFKQIESIPHILDTKELFLLLRDNVSAKLYKEIPGKYLGNKAEYLLKLWGYSEPQYEIY